MKVKLYIRYEEKLPGYWVMKEQGVLKNQKALLSLLIDLFFSFNNGHIWVSPDEDNPDIITVSLHFLEDDEDDYDADSVLKMSRENYEYIEKKFKRISKENPKYFILFYDDKGWIDVEQKNELSQDDWRYIDQEKYKQLS